MQPSPSPPLGPSSSTLTASSSVISSIYFDGSITSTSSYKGSIYRRSSRKTPSPTLLSVKLLSHKLGGFYKLFSSSASAPVLSTLTSKPQLGRSKSCDRALTMSELTQKYTIEKTMSLRAMELEALINDYPSYTLHLTLTPRLCLDK